MILHCVRRFLLRHRYGIAIWIAGWITIGLLVHRIIDQDSDVSINDRLFVDESSPLTEFEMAGNVQAAIPNLPSVFLLERRYPKRRWNATCAYLPSLFDIKINQKFWQHFRMTRADINVYLYAAYYDNRVLVPAAGGKATSAPLAVITHVRVLAMIDRFFNETIPLICCQFWRENSKVPIFSGPAKFDFAWQLKWGYTPGVTLLPVLVSCPLSQGSAIPRVVSLVERQCDNATNALLIQHSKPAERRPPTSSKSFFAVCVKGLTFHDRDLSVRLVEWLELLRLVGADRVFLYEMAVHPNISRVLQHYVASGFVDLTPLTLAGDQTTDPDLLTLYFHAKVIPYNDCLYRNLYRYRYVVLMDIDEAIIPTKPEHRTWKEMLHDAIASASISGGNETTTVSPVSISRKEGGDEDNLDGVNFSSLCARNVYFFDNTTPPADSEVSNMADVPKYMHMLQHVVRAVNYTRLRHYNKCFHSTLRVLTLHNHFPTHCLTARCLAFHIPPTSGHLQHYRHGCTYGEEMRCSADYMRDTVTDKSIWKYKSELIRNVRRVLRHLGFISSA